MTSAIEVGGSRSASRLLVGRGDELARLEALVDEIVAGHRLGTVLVEGPAGIGKTRVVDELGARLQRPRHRRRGRPLRGSGRADAALRARHGAAGRAGTPRGRGRRTCRRRPRRRRSSGRLVPALGARRGYPRPTAPAPPRLFQAISTLLQPQLPAAAGGRDRGRALGRHVDPRAVGAAGAGSSRATRPAAAHAAHRRVTRPRPGLTRYLAELVRRGDHRVALQPLTRERAGPTRSATSSGVPPHPRPPRGGVLPGRGQPVLRRGAAGPRPAGRRRAPGHRARPAPGQARGAPARRPGRCFAPPA